MTQPDGPAKSPVTRSTEITDGFMIGGSAWTLGLALLMTRETWFAPFVFVVPAWRYGDALAGTIVGIMAVFLGFLAGWRGRSLVGLAAAGVGLAATFMIPAYAAGHNAGALQALAAAIPLPEFLFLILATYWLAKSRGRRPSRVSGFLQLGTIAGWAMWGWVGLMSLRGY